MRPNLNNVGGVAPYAKRVHRHQAVLAKSHGSQHLSQNPLPTTLCPAAKIPKHLLVGQALPAPEAFALWFKIHFPGVCVWAVSGSVGLVWATSGGSDRPKFCSRKWAAAPWAIAMLPRVSSAWTQRSPKWCVRSGVPLNLKPQHVFPILATMGRTIASPVVSANHRNLGKKQKQTCEPLFKCLSSYFQSKHWGFSMTTKSSPAPLPLPFKIFLDSLELTLLFTLFSLWLLLK